MRVRLGGFIYCGSCFVLFFFQSRSSRFPCSFLLLFLKSFVSSGSIYFYSRSKGKEKLKEVLYFGISLKRKIFPYLSINFLYSNSKRKGYFVQIEINTLLQMFHLVSILFSSIFLRFHPSSFFLLLLRDEESGKKKTFGLEIISTCACCIYYSPYFDTSMPLRKVSTGSRNKETAASCRERRARTVR